VGLAVFINSDAGGVAGEGGNYRDRFSIRDLRGKRQGNKSVFKTGRFVLDIAEL
jgi:hypothetical protein